MYARIVRRACLRLLHTVQETLRKTITPSDEVQTHMLCMELCDLFLQKGIKEIQQEIHLTVRALPVLRGERIDRQHLDPHL